MDKGAEMQEYLKSLTGHATVPNIYIQGKVCRRETVNGASQREADRSCDIDDRLSFRLARRRKRCKSPLPPSDPETTGSHKLKPSKLTHVLSRSSRYLQDLDALQASGELNKMIQIAA
jgi:hypothetical protein